MTLIWWLEALLSLVGPLTVSTHVAGGLQAQWAVSSGPCTKVFAPSTLLSGTGAASFHRQHATGANPGVQSCLVPCRKAVCCVLVTACCVLAGWPYASSAALGVRRLGAVSYLSFSPSKGYRDVTCCEGARK